MKQLNVPQSGSLGGVTASHNRAGQYLRNRRTPTQPVGTGRRAAQRSNFGGASSAWASLSFSEQAAWGAYADGHPVTDALGQAIKLTGHQMFVSINAQLLNVGEIISTVPPVSSDVFNVGAVTFTAVGAGAITMTLEGNGSADDFAILSFSAPKSSGVSFNKTFWQDQVIAGDTSTATVVTVPYQAQFGVPPVGSRIFFKVTPVNQYGVTGVPVIGFATVS